MKSMRGFLVLVVMLMVGAAYQVAQAHGGMSPDFCRGPGGWFYGGDVPVPFSTTNKAVELADGEKYSLIGTIEYISDEFVFKVDLDDHPWLATKARKATPYYPVVGGKDYWGAYLNRRVMVVVQATGRVVGAQSDTPTYQIILKPLRLPMEQFPEPWGDWTHPPKTRR